MRWLPTPFQAYVKTTLRFRTTELWRLTLATASPSMKTRADPRDGPRDAIHAIWWPVNGNAAVEPFERDDFAALPRKPDATRSGQDPWYDTPCRSVAYRT